ncbi:putative enzyme related to lactoylglutathione lyase [Herbihabitans rhizosphaerae]|uniref:Putative enzyme related to lactoylglutathione lyase n=1 Tax=Herbihabitans rhizosphaerae TaxID=1872711 RepID=A0A4Q7L4J4_9PSEU|nr:VOC family protein [Herbihabitans rhizosphaerae]RZS44548.1 putative enzyme related to lactoylglutathione lyase [Herbihabitans rhizosphaerae]
MERITGIGGLFFRARDPEALTAWYEDNLGVRPPPASYDERSWDQEAGPTVFSAFPADSEHFRRPEQQWAVNFRVRDLDAMVAQLRGAGIEVEVHEETYPNGRFADLADPEGNPVQLWEPAGADRVE